MSLVIYNTESQKKEEFVPVEAGKVKMYVCGPTVYGLLHVGNFRGPIFFNLVRNWLEHLNYQVTYVYNYTDVDDKIINKAAEEKTTADDIANTYIKAFEDDFKRLNLKKHDHNPRVTDYVAKIVTFIQKIIDSGAAYVEKGEVIFSVKHFKEYGKLSHKNLEDLMSGIRVEVSDKKQNPLDFTLWKPAKPGEPKWPSPWSEGRPGWHIECSVMASALLGDQIDIHGGGVDLIFPHHENEIAQSESVTKKLFVKYWMHNNFLNFGTQKMSKSLGNIRTARSFLDQYGPEIMKFMYLRTHYRSLVDFSEHQIQDSIQGLARIYSALSEAKVSLDLANVKRESAPAKLIEAIKVADSKIEEALNDDFNTPKAFAQIYDVIRTYNSLYKRGQKVTGPLAGLFYEFYTWLTGKGKMMSLFQEAPEAFLVRLDDLLLDQKQLKRDDINQIVKERSGARANKDFKKSDELRDKLAAMGIKVMDTPERTEWEVQK